MARRNGRLYDPVILMLQFFWRRDVDRADSRPDEFGGRRPKTATTAGWPYGTVRLLALGGGHAAGVALHPLEDRSIPCFPRLPSVRGALKNAS